MGVLICKPLVKELSVTNIDIELRFVLNYRAYISLRFQDEQEKTGAEFMTSRTTNYFDFLEIIPLSTKIGRDNILHILSDSGFWTATLQHYDSRTGEYKIMLQGNLLPAKDTNAEYLD